MNREQTKKKLCGLYSDSYDFDSFYVFVKELMKDGPTRDELLGFIDAIKANAVLLKPDIDYSKTIDISGTGGDKIKTVNVGSLASLILSSAGLFVSKQSTRAYTGYTGSKDILEYLSIPVEHESDDPERVTKLLENTGFTAFYHPAFTNNFENSKKFFTEFKTRGIKEITPWHIAAWLFCPTQIQYRVYGMFTNKYMDIAADILMDQNVKKGWIVYGVDGLDEVSNIGQTEILEFDNGSKKKFTLSPEDFGIKKSNKEDIIVNNAEEAIREADDILSGKDSPMKDLVVINAATGLYLTGLVDNLKDGTEMAKKLLKSGKVREKIEEIRAQF